MAVQECKQYEYRISSNKGRALKMICNGFLAVKVNCWSYVFNPLRPSIIIIFYFSIENQRRTEARLGLGDPLNRAHTGALGPQRVNPEALTHAGLFTYWRCGVW